MPPWDNRDRPAGCKFSLGERCLARLFFRHTGGLLVLPVPVFPAVFSWKVQEMNGFVPGEDMCPFQQLDEARFWRLAWAFSSFSFYVGSREETRRYYCADVGVDTISADTPLPALPFPLPQAIFKDNEWAPAFLKTQLWLQQRSMFSGYIATHRKWKAFFFFFFFFSPKPD